MQVETTLLDDILRCCAQIGDTSPDGSTYKEWRESRYDKKC